MTIAAPAEAVACHSLARKGSVVQESFPVAAARRNTRAKLAELIDQPGFAATFLNQGGFRHMADHCFPVLANTLEQLLVSAILPWRCTADYADLAPSAACYAADLAVHQAQIKPPLQLRLSDATVYNMAPPTQGIASLLILGIYDRIRQNGWNPDNAEGIHALVEATKQAFLLRDKYVTDPAHMNVDPVALLSDKTLHALAAAVPLQHASLALPVPMAIQRIGVVDAEDGQ
jgi:gamma-glutamyltranspeptidase/glutathione hydrolase